MTAGRGRDTVNSFTRALATTTILVGLAGVAQTPAMAQERYRDGYDRSDRSSDRRDRDYRDDRDARDRDRNWDRDRDRDRDREWRRDREYRAYDWDRRSDRTWRPGRYDYVYRGYDNRYYCRRSDGTTGLIVGGISGGVLGNIIAPGDSKALGTILGGVGGAILGRSIDRNHIVCR
jgi:hypothetical protein